MYFFVRHGESFGEEVWLVQFLEVDLKTSVGRRRTFASADKIRELVARTPTRLLLEDKQAFEYAIQKGRGALYLDLTQEQYGKLWA